MTAFLVDLTAHLNVLNAQLQSHKLLVPNMVTKINAFQVKLMLCKAQPKKKDFANFTKLTSLKPTQPAAHCYATAVADLRKEFESCFKDFNKHSLNLRIFCAPSISTQLVCSQICR